jgi:hypothetical protein
VREAEVAVIMLPDAGRFKIELPERFELGIAR